MDWHELALHVLLIIVGVATGFLNTLAGGGSLISMPILIFMGLPSTVANGTNRLAVLMQTIFAAKGFANKGVELPTPYAFHLSIFTVIGGLIGVLLALVVPAVAFNKILSMVMVVVLGLIVLDGNGSPHRATRKEKMSASRKGWGKSIFFLLGIYIGFIQAGVGFLIIITLTYLHNLSLVKANYMKVFVGILSTGLSLIVFALAGKIAWTWGATLAVGQGLGGWHASRWSVNKGDKWIKRILVLSVIPLAIKLWFF